MDDFEHGLPVRADFFSCSQCGLAFLWPRPTPAALASYYPQDYRPHAAAHRAAQRKTLLSLLKDLQARMLIRKFAGLLPTKSAPILDVGCGGGNFLKALRAAGYTQLTGVDQNAALADVFAGEGIKFVAADVESGLPGADRYEAVVLNYSLEHFLTPRAVLEHCRARLLPGGRILVLTPNADSLCHRVFGRFWSGLHSPRHVHVFSPGNLSALAQSAGLRLTHRRFLSDPASWAISFQNLMTSRVRGPGPARGTRWYTLAILPFWLPFAVIENWFNRGSSVIVVLSANRDS